MPAPAAWESGEPWTPRSFVFLCLTLFSVLHLCPPPPPAMIVSHPRLGAAAGPMAGRPLPSIGRPPPLAAGLGPGAGAACVFSFFRHGSRRPATELRQLRSEERGVSACEVSPLQCRFAINLYLSTSGSVCVICCRACCSSVWMFLEFRPRGSWLTYTPNTRVGHLFSEPGWSLTRGFWKPDELWVQRKGL